jgi:bifunctional enzyme CysN/CysC
MPSQLMTDGASSPLPTLRFITCGSVDDGKSTLIGRLLHDTRSIYDDQLTAVTSDSRRHGTRGERVDLALLLDGLLAEREQGITIDVAYRFFAVPGRRFIVADTPGHEQYTRNMATGASTASLAVLLIDARKGILVQTCRHARIAALVGIRQIVLAVNKMDLMDFSESTFREIDAAFREFSKDLGFTTITSIPMCAVDGDNVIAPSDRMPWYTGPALLECLMKADVHTTDAAGPFRMPVQWVCRPNLDFRGFAGRVARGRVAPGDRVRVLPSGVESTVKSVVAWQGTLPAAEAGDSVTITLADEVDASRGDAIVAAGAPPEVADQFQAHLLWMSEHELVPGRQYLMKIHANEVTATVTALKHKIEMNTGAHLAARTLAMNEIAVATISINRGITFEPYADNRPLGSFVIIDRLTFETVGAGMIDYALRRASNIHWQALNVDRSARASLKHQAPKCIWFTGLSGSGKSTIANLVERRLHADGRHTYLLDGDNVRHGLNRDLGFTEADRAENVRRVAEVARLMVDAGLIVLVSFISPYRAERDQARSLFGEDEFVEVFVDTPVEVCEARDPKGLYKKARAGDLKNFTGIDAPYEAPLDPEVRVDTTTESAEQAAQRISAATT